MLKEGKPIQKFVKPTEKIQNKTEIQKVSAEGKAGWQGIGEEWDDSQAT